MEKLFCLGTLRAYGWGNAFFSISFKLLFHSLTRQSSSDKQFSSFKWFTFLLQHKALPTVHLPLPAHSDLWTIYLLLLAWCDLITSIFNCQPCLYTLPRPFSPNTSSHIPPTKKSGTVHRIHSTAGPKEDYLFYGLWANYFIHSRLIVEQLLTPYFDSLKLIQTPSPLLPTTPLAATPHWCVTSCTPPQLVLFMRHKSTRDVFLKAKH